MDAPPPPPKRDKKRQLSLREFMAQEGGPSGLAPSPAMGQTTLVTFTEREQALDAREHQLAEKEAALAARERDLWEAEALLDARRKALETQHAARLAKAHVESPSTVDSPPDEALAALRARLEEQARALETQETLLAERERFLEESESTLLDKGLRLTEIETRLAHLEDQLHTREARIARHEKDLGLSPPPPSQEKA